MVVVFVYKFEVQIRVVESESEILTRMEGDVWVEKWTELENKTEKTAV